MVRTAAASAAVEEEQTMDGGEPADVTLVEEDAHANLARISGGSDVLAFRRARFLKPRAAADHPSAAPSPRGPLLQDLVPRRLVGRWPPNVDFWGWPLPGDGWHRWLQRLHPVYRKVWRSAGIRDAITASTCTVLVEAPVFFGLLECWKPETNTFVFPWPRPAEATVTLEDVMILGGFSVLGEPVRAASAAGVLEEDELLARLTVEHGAGERLSGCGWVPHGDWAGRFMGLAGGEPGDLEHAAFLVLWLSRYVFPAPPRGSVVRHLLPLAGRFMGIYRDLRLLNLAVLNGGGADRVDAWAPFQLLQLWAWERLESFRPPKPPRPLSQGKSRAMRWDNLGHQRRSLASVRSVLASPSEFRWRPYAAMVNDWCHPSLYGYGDRWVTVGSGGEEDDEMRSYARCLRACKLVGLDSVEHYAPQRVAMQFGLDQDLPGSIPPVDGGWEVAWATYDTGDELVRFYVPPRFYEPRPTRRFLDWQKQCALDRGDDARKMAKRRKKRLQEKRRRLRKNGNADFKGIGVVPDNGRRGLQIGTQEVHEHGLSPVGEEPRKLAEQGDEQRWWEGELLTEDGEQEMHSSGDSRSMKRIKRMEAGDVSASEVVDDELDRVKEGYVLKTNEQQSSCSPIMTKEPKIGMSPSRIAFIETESDDKELQGTEEAGEESAVEVPDPEPNREKEAHVLSTNAPEKEDHVVAKETVLGMLPRGITFIEIESDDEELQRQRELEFDREIDQLKAEIASLQAMITKLEAGAQMEPANTPHLSQAYFTP